MASFLSLPLRTQLRFRGMPIYIWLSASPMMNTIFHNAFMISFTVANGLKHITLAERIMLLVLVGCF